ncbi:MAG: M23 family metallopeptidase, partial [Clostridia bacterium]|nr:M23 family metallopeptidase [Clostridia bacterium]
IFTNGESFKAGESVVISWDEISGASKYEVCISKSPYGSDNIVIDTEVINAYYVAKKLPDGAYRANVKALGGSGSSNYSNRVYFTVGSGVYTEVSSNEQTRQQEKVEEKNETPAVVTPPASTSGISFVWPVKESSSYSGSSFAITAMDLYYDGGYHGSLRNALDINHDGMTTRYETREIVAAADGVVMDVHYCGHSGITCSTRSCDGCYIKIKHNFNVKGEEVVRITAYVHLDPKTVKVEEGEYVKAGQTIARMGSTGNSSGIHLHFAIRDANNKDLPTLEYYMNSTYMPKLQFKYFKEDSQGHIVTTRYSYSKRATRYNDWITDHYRYSSSQNRWVYNK